MKVGCASFFRWRLGFFVLALLSVAAVIGYTEHLAWRQLRFSLEKQRTINPDRFNLAQKLEAEILQINESVRRFQSNGLPADRYVFQHGREVVQNLIETHVDRLTPAENIRLSEINLALTPYFEELTGLLKRKTLAAFSESPEDILRLIETKAAPVLALCHQFESAQQTAFNDWLGQAKGSTRELQHLLLAWAVLLPIGGVWLLAMVYRRTVAPLQIRLEESQLIIERQEKLASLGIFAAGVAHEIRNPLMAMKVHLFSLAKHLPNASPGAEKVTILGNEINRLERIVQDFLQFARPADPVIERFDANQLLGEVTDLLKVKCEENHVAIQVTTKGTLLVDADRAQIKQVLLNLVKNATESIENKGTVTLRARTGVDNLQGGSGPVVYLEIEDNGKGIPAQVQKRLFDPFFTTKAKGTGLGLSISMRIVEKHGGTIRYHTAPEQGTTFTVLLPQSKTL